jgi:RNA polymerase sigma-70 factor (ECF subfamily)
MRDQDFERLYEEQGQPLFGFLVYRTGNRALAEDVLADTFERALRARNRFNPNKASKKTWIYAIALNVLRDHIRRQGAESRALERAGEPPGSNLDSPQASVENRDALQRALTELSAAERETIALRYGADLSAPEISKLTGERLTTVEGRLYRGLGKLRDQLESDADAQSPARRTT